MKRRFVILQLVFVLAALIISVRFFALQVMSNDFYTELAENQHQLSQTLVPERGEVFLRDRDSGELVPVIANTERDLIFAVPPEIESKTQTAKLLADLLELDESELKERISDNDRQWIVIKKQVPESLSLQVQELELTGIYFQPETERIYPETDFASQVFGFVGFSGDEEVGQYGVERAYDEELSGKSGFLEAEKDAFGRLIAKGERDLTPAEDGVDLILTIDQAVQFKAEEVLARAVEWHGAESGSLVALDPKTGAVLALANYPSFDPNSFNTVEDPGVFRNLVVSDSYEPGSVFKPITVAAALNEEAITPDLTYEDTGVAEIDGFRIHNSDNKAHGEQTMTQVLEKSLNTGVIFIQDQLGPEKFLETIRRFGFGQLTGIDLPAEAAGTIENLLGGGDIHYATASFGQGITSTLIQLAQSYATIANGGVMHQPYLVQEKVYPDGQTEIVEPDEGRQVVSPRAANTTAAMLVSVVENGQAGGARVPGYYVAGKTGTAQVVAETGGYDPDNTIGTFVGFGPIENPRFVVAVKIDRPEGRVFAASTAAPVFGQMVQFLVNYYQIPPSR